MEGKWDKREGQGFKFNLITTRGKMKMIKQK